jgi:uncharacterized membrane protein YkvA (DUF1232 family)
MSDENEEKERPMERSVAIDKAVEESKQRQGFIIEMVDSVRLVWRLLRDPEVPIYLKLFPLIAIAYVVYPFDLLPDLMPALGQVDDLTALLAGLRIFIALTPDDLVQRHRSELAAGRQKEPKLDQQIIIDPEYRVEEETE